LPSSGNFRESTKAATTSGLLPSAFVLRISVFVAADVTVLSLARGVDVSDTELKSDEEIKMAFSVKKFVTAVAWGLAFDSAAETVLAGAYGGWAGSQLKKGRSVDEIIASRADTWTKWDKIVPPVVGVIGLSLGLMGLLPGTENKSSD
jgi:hypothetical protein